MTKIKKTQLLILVTVGFFLLLDRLLKWQATHTWSQTSLVNKYLGWQPFLNHGAAFSLSIPNWIIIISTAIIIGFIFFLLLKEYNTTALLWAWSLVLAGASSNLFDRLVYHGVIDYLVILTGIINLADTLIVIGLAIYIMTNFKK